jgi:hypothetical protein
MLRPRLILCNSGASAAEFAMVLPLLILFLLGIIDAGRLAWQLNRAEKATQAGARVAAVTNSFPSGLKTENYVGQSVTTSSGTVTLTQGDLIPREALGEILCTRAGGCSCATAPCPATIGTIDTDVFDNVLLPRMKAMYGAITAANVELRYSGSGLGFAGDPNGMEIAPLVTVQLVSTQAAPLKFTPISTLRMASFSLPSFRTTLTAEDASGDKSF